ncbi:hypothetical protein Acr_27g0000430 [Actinidia rufa]|uniref:Uncharacterized protein n=1 Tax=Actinidia rufa TaxID=165716 RepID=A0A7J0DCH7_9ERIC|nr:hypothetical protein Acr_00g0015950 [Actinidia rufa]GFZ06946.1 hypothetical protein Acr_18g0011160 [Actinidia rufa]GFZ18304.1 hypothetical protein Acr_27g0000430 [Actinidia rufa]
MTATRAGGLFTTNVEFWLSSSWFRFRRKDKVRDIKVPIVFMRWRFPMQATSVEWKTTALPFLTDKKQKAQYHRKGAKRESTRQRRKQGRSDPPFLNLERSGDHGREADRALASVFSSEECSIDWISISLATTEDNKAISISDRKDYLKQI